MKKLKFKFLYTLLLLFLTSTLSGANEKVTLQLKWFHQFQFAGYYAAKEKGFYDEVGLDVEIKERDLKYNNIEQVINEEAHYGIADSVLLLYKSKNEPVVIVSPIFQHSPGVLLTLKSSGLNSPYILNNKKTVFYSNDTDGFAILAMMNKMNVKPELIRRKEKADYLKLMNQEIDVLSAYLSNEPFYFKQKGIDVNIINPMNYGFDLYGDMLFTNENEVKNHPQRVERFKKASLKGWKYALEHKSEIIELIQKKYNTTKSIEHLEFEAKAIEHVISQDTVPLGTIDKGRIEYIYNLYKEYGLTSEVLNINDFIFQDFHNSENKINLTADEREYLNENPVLKVQNMMAFPPFNFNEKETPLGYTVDYMKILGEHLGITIEFISGKTWAQNLEMLKNKELDVMPHIAINEERKQFIDFTNSKHIEYKPSLAVRKESTVQSLEDLKDKTISVLNKSFVHTIFKNNFPHQSLYLADTPSKAVEAVSLGKADAVIDNLSTIEYYIKKNWLSNLKTVQINDSKFFKKTPLPMGVAKNNHLLKSILNKAINSVSHLETLQLQKKWMDLQVSKKILFNEKELGYLKKKEALNMCIDPNWMPYERIKNGKHVGITADYIELFKKELSLPINLVSTKDWSQTVEYGKNRKCDFITIMIDTKERKKYFNFSHKYLKSPLIIATKVSEPFISDIASVANKKLGIVKGYAYKQMLQKEYPTINIIDVNDIKDGLQKVKNGELFGFIDALPAVGYTIQQDFIGDLKITGQIDKNSNFSIATRNDEPILNDIFNKLIDNISLNEHNNLLNKWISIKYEESIDYTKVLFFALFLFIVIAIILYKNRSIQGINETLARYINIVDQNILTSSTDLEGNITYVSQAFCEVSEYSKEELLGHNHNLIRHPDMPEKLFAIMWKEISSGNTWKGEIKNKKKGGGFYWVDATISPIMDEKNKIVGYTAIRQDITDKKIIEEISITDGLTNIYNRRHFNELFPKFINSAKRNNDYIAFIIMDVDHFKQYNDTYGHQKGDDVLIAIANELKTQTHRADDYCFRLGGEEFGVLFKSDNQETAYAFSNKMRQMIEQLHIPHEHNSASKYVTASFGLYFKRASEIQDMDEAFKTADGLLYKAKGNGRNRVVMSSL